MPDLTSLIITVGYLGLFGIVFAESGLFFGFFLPGDSLLFTAGFLASQGILNVWILIGVTFAGAVLGDNFGYMFGRKVGPAIFKKEDSLLFSKENLVRAKKFYERHGAKTIILARFIPFGRTFAPILAGVGEMPYKSFLFYNIVGGALWTIGLSLIGYGLGNSIPNADKYILPIVLLILFISVVPTFIHLIGNRDYRREILSKLRSILRKLKRGRTI
jgi:membrane-associated protein